MQCLEDDLRRGDQFLRLAWLYAAVTICDRHHLPLWPVEQSLGSLQCICNPSGSLFVFYARHQGRYSVRHEDAAPLRALCRFEQALRLALDGHPSGLFGLEGSAFVAVVNDLIWALLQPAAGGRHQNRTPFPGRSLSRAARLAHAIWLDRPFWARHTVSPSDSRDDRLSAPSLLIRRTHHPYKRFQPAKDMRASAGTTWRREHLRAYGSRPSLAAAFPRPHGKRCSSAAAPHRRAVVVYRLAAKIY